MNLTDVLYKRFTAATPDGSLYNRAKSPTSEGATAARVMGELERAHGSQAAAARAAGVGYSTWRDVRKGRHNPSKATIERLRGAQRAWRMRNATAFRTWPGVVLVARISISSDDRTRALQVGRWSTTGTSRNFAAVQQDVVDAWLRGDDTTAAALWASVVEAELRLTPGSFDTHFSVDDVRYFPTEHDAAVWARAVPVIKHE